eukprot:g2804.t1
MVWKPSIFFVFSLSLVASTLHEERRERRQGKDRHGKRENLSALTGLALRAQQEFEAELSRFRNQLHTKVALGNSVTIENRQHLYNAISTSNGEGDGNSRCNGYDCKTCKECIEDSHDNVWCVEGKKCYPPNMFGGRNIHVRFSWQDCHHTVRAQEFRNAGELCAKGNALSDNWQRNRKIRIAAFAIAMALFLAFLCAVGMCFLRLKKSAFEE